MRQDPTALSVSPSGVLFVSGFATSLRVERRALVVRSGSGRSIREGIFPKVQRPRLRRVVVYGKGGFTTWDALAWLDGIGASFLYLSTPGRILASSGERATNQPALLRAQIEAAETETGLQIVKRLLGMKCSGQRSILERFFPADRSAIEAVGLARERVEDAQHLPDALAAEAKAASVFWGSLATIPMKFARADLPRIPERWLTVGERHSLLSASPRLAVTPAHAIVNCLYGLAEFECRLALLALAMDPQLGWAHRDTPYRDSASLDLLEAIRPSVDAYVLTLLSERTFSRREFLEAPNGQVRLAPGLAKLLAESTLVQWERSVAPIAEEVARRLASSARNPLTVRTRLTHADRRRGRVGVGARGRGRIPSSCQMCGETLWIDDRGHTRKICDSCLPTYEKDRTRTLAAAGRNALAEMRASANDPARSTEALAKLSATASRRDGERRAWDREHRGKIDPGRYERVVRPVIEKMGTAELARRTGLTKHYCWQVRKGAKRLHPRHWQAVLDGC